MSLTFLLQFKRTLYRKQNFPYHWKTWVISKITEIDSVTCVLKVKILSFSRMRTDRPLLYGGVSVQTGSLSGEGSLYSGRVSVQVGLCPKRSLSMESLSRGSLSRRRGLLSRQVSVWESFFPGISVPGPMFLLRISVKEVSAQGGSLSSGRGFLSRWISVRETDKEPPQTVKSGWYAS